MDKKSIKFVTPLSGRKTRTRKTAKDLIEKYRLFFNERRNAQIAIIGSVSTADPTNREIRVRYEDGHEVSLGDDVLSWTNLFDKLSEMHPKPVKDPDLS
jgi:hypothetical protein